MPAGMWPRQNDTASPKMRIGDVGGAQMRGGGEAVGAGADDRDGGIVARGRD